MYRLGATFLRKDILADGFLALLKPKLTQQRNDLRIYITGAAPTVLWRVQIDALVRGIAEVATDGDGSSRELYYYLFQAGSFV